MSPGKEWLAMLSKSNKANCFSKVGGNMYLNVPVNTHAEILCDYCSSKLKLLAQFDASTEFYNRCLYVAICVLCTLRLKHPAISAYRACYLNYTHCAHIIESHNKASLQKALFRECDEWGSDTNAPNGEGIQESTPRGNVRNEKSFVLLAEKLLAVDQEVPFVPIFLPETALLSESWIHFKEQLKKYRLKRLNASPLVGNYAKKKNDCAQEMSDSSNETDAEDREGILSESIQLFSRFTQYIQKTSSRQLIRLTIGSAPILASMSYTLPFKSKMHTLCKNTQPEIEVPTCKRCGSTRNFEFQLMPHFLDYIYNNIQWEEMEMNNADMLGLLNALEFATAIIYTCSAHCYIVPNTHTLVSVPAINEVVTTKLPDLQTTGHLTSEFVYLQTEPTSIIL